MKLVRFAGDHDIDYVIELVKEAREESVTFKQFYEADEEYVRRSLLAMLDNPNYFILIARDYNMEQVGPESRTTGVFIGLISPSWFSPTVEATELFLYVTKDYRGSRDAVKLLREFEKQLKGTGAKRIVAGNSLEINSKTVRKLYKGLGYTVDGDSFTKVLNV